MAAIQAELSEDEHYLETALLDRGTPDRSSVPFYLKVDKDTDNSSILQQLYNTHVPWFKPCNYDVDADVNQQVALVLRNYHGSNCPWETIHKEAQDAQDNSIYTSAVQAAVTFVYFLYNKEFLFKTAHKHAWGLQMNVLWEELIVLGKKGGSILDASKLIAQLVPDKEKYSFLTEEDVADLLCHYGDQVKYIQQNNYDNNRCYIHMGQVEFPENPEKDQIFEDIHTVIKEMKSTPTILKDNLYTRVLINLLRGGPVRQDQEEWLIEEALKILHKHKLNEDLILRLHIFFVGLVADWKITMQHQLASVWQPLTVVNNIRADSFASEAVEIIQVAELRRMALGSRFIGRSHLIWAFYECGFGLPFALRERVKFSSVDEDHPPYHIYVAALKLAESVGETIMGFECFVFAVLFSDNIGFDEEKVNEMQKDFKNFLEVMLRSTENSGSDSLIAKRASSFIKVETKSWENLSSVSRDT